MRTVENLMFVVINISSLAVTKFTKLMYLLRVDVKVRTKQIVMNINSSLRVVLQHICIFVDYYWTRSTLNETRQLLKRRIIAIGNSRYLKHKAWILI